jgi:hypothetical protein
MGAGNALSDGSGMTTGFNSGVGSGNQISNVIQVPVDLCGNAISLAGFASASCVGGAGASNGGGGAEGMTTGFNAGVLSGNQISNVVQVPVSVCGNSIAVLGFADASCVGGAWANNGGGMVDPGDDDDDNGDGGNSGDPYDDGGAAGAGASGHHARGAGHGAGSGAAHRSAKAAKKAAKANHSDEHGRGGAAGFGRHHAGGSGMGANGYNGNGNGSGSGSGSGAGSCDGGDMITGFNSGVLSGNQFSNTIQIPVDLSGNAISLLGFASASSVGGASATNC